MDRPRFSIITCVYNGEKYLQQCLDSVKNQTFKKYEHIIVYTDSTDRTLEMITKYQIDNAETNIKLIETTKNGIANAMNRGIAAATGEYIHILHSDDWYWGKDSLSYIDYLINSTHKQVLIGPKTLQYGKIIFNLRILKHFTNRQILFLLKIANLIPHASLFMTKKLFDQCGKFDESLKIGMDYDLWFRVLKKDNFVVYDKSTVVYRRHRGSVSSRFSNLYRMLIEDIKIKQKYHVFGQEK